MSKKSLCSLTNKEKDLLLQQYKEFVDNNRTKSYDDLMELVYNSGVDYTYEQMYFIVHNTYNLPLEVLKYSSASKDTVEMNIDIVIKKILDIDGAARITVLHNHPGNGVDPSDDDDATATQMYHAFRLVGLQLVDFIIFNKLEIFSYRSNYENFFESMSEKFKFILNNKEDNNEV